MPTFNRRDFIGEAIDSVLRQKGCYELLIVDDCSSDGTMELVFSNYSRELECGLIRYHYSTTKLFASGCRNVALSLAKGNWIGYIDSDNILCDNYLSTFIDCINRCPEVEIFYAQFKRLTDNGPGLSIPFDPLILKHHNYIDIGVFVHKKQLYEKCGGFDESLRRLEDWDLILRYTSESVPIFIDQIVMVYNDEERIDRVTLSTSEVDAFNAISKKMILNIPLVSALVVTYNAAPYIRKALESALMQDGHFRYEIVITDDKSTDETPRIIEEYAKKYPDKIRVLRNEDNLGISGNYKRGIEACKGDYIAFLEGDDYWCDEFKLYNQLIALESNKSSVLCFSNIKIMEGDQEITPNKEVKESELYFSDLHKYDFNPIKNLSSCFLDSTFLKEIDSDIYKTRINEVVLSVLSLKHGPILFLNKKMTVYRLHDSRVWGGLSFEDKVLFSYKEKLDLLPFLNKNDKSDLLCFIYRTFFLNKKFKKALCSKLHIKSASIYVVKTLGFKTIIKCTIENDTS